MAAEVEDHQHTWKVMDSESDMPREPQADSGVLRPNP